MLKNGVRPTEKKKPKKEKIHPQVKLQGEIGVKYHARNKMLNKEFNPITG